MPKHIRSSVHTPKEASLPDTTTNLSSIYAASYNHDDVGTDEQVFVCIVCTLQKSRQVWRRSAVRRGTFLLRGLHATTLTSTTFNFERFQNSNEQLLRGSTMRLAAVRSKQQRTRERTPGSFLCTNGHPTQFPCNAFEGVPSVFPRLVRFS